MYNERWFNGLAEEKANVLRELLSNDNLILDRLVQMCYNTINELEAQQLDFNTPNWAHRQASLLGERKALKRIIALCKSTAKEPDPVL